MRDVRVYFQDVLESIAAIERYTAGMDWDTFAANGQAQDAVIRRLEIIGEAVKGIPEEYRRRLPMSPGGTSPGCGTFLSTSTSVSV